MLWTSTSLFFPPAHVPWWPMADGGARGRCRALSAPCGASGTRYESMRGLLGSRRVPSTYRGGEKGAH
eukprot:2650599-Prymnesium_polylepis.1